MGRPGGTVSLSLEEANVINPETYRQVVLERRCMAAATVATTACMALFISAVATTYWAIIDFVGPKRENVTIMLGIWGEWRDARNATHTTRSEWLSHFPEPPDHSIRLADDDLPHFYRAQAVFSVIALVLMLASNALAYYAFTHHRYIYKRLTACLHVFSAMCVVLVIEVLTLSIDEWRVVIDSTDWTDVVMEAIGLADAEWLQEKEKRVTIDELDITYGYSTIVSWVVVAVYVLAAILFVFGGRKRKGSRAATSEFEIEDRPVNIGR